MTSPHLKDSVQKAIMGFVFDPFNLYIKKRIDKLIAKNAQLTKATQYGFMYRTEVYTGTNTQSLRPPYPRLHKDLIPEMEKIVREQDTVFKYEMPLLKGVLCHAMNLTRNPIEFFKLLPEELHQPLLVWKTQLEPLAHAGDVLDATAEEFKKKYEYAFDIIRVRIITNLIL